MGPCSGVKFPRAHLLLVLFATSRAIARQTGADFSATSTNATALPYSLSPPSLLIEDRRAQPDVIAGKKFQISDPLVRPFKGIQLKKLWAAPGRLLQAINPFATTASKEERGYVNGLSPRA